MRSAGGYRHVSPSTSVGKYLKTVGLLAEMILQKEMRRREVDREGKKARQFEITKVKMQVQEENSGEIAATPGLIAGRQSHR